MKIYAIYLRSSLIILILLGFCKSGLTQEPEAPNLKDDKLIDGMPAGMQPWRDPDNPNIMLLDDRHYNTGLMVNRMMRVMLASMAARKTGITDPDYIAPESLNTR